MITVQSKSFNIFVTFYVTYLIPKIFIHIKSLRFPDFEKKLVKAGKRQRHRFLMERQRNFSVLKSVFVGKKAQNKSQSNLLNYKFKIFLLCLYLLFLLYRSKLMQKRKKAIEWVLLSLSLFLCNFRLVIRLLVLYPGSFESHYYRKRAFGHVSGLYTHIHNVCMQFFIITLFFSFFNIYKKKETLKCGTFEKPYRHLVGS